MKIRREQLTQFLASDGKLLHAALRNIVREDYRQVVEGLPDDLLDEVLARGIKTARGFGLSRPPDIAGFVLVMFEVGPEFYAHPEIHRILTDPSIPPDRRLAAALGGAPPRAWDEVVATLHRQTWFPELRQQEQ